MGNVLRSSVLRDPENGLIIAKSDAESQGKSGSFLPSGKSFFYANASFEGVLPTFEELRGARQAGIPDWRCQASIALLREVDRGNREPGVRSPRQV